MKGVWGYTLAQKIFEHPNLLVFETKEGKNAQKVKKILTIIFRYLFWGGGGGGGGPKATCVGILTQKMFEI
jgi:hypothetical protein